MPFERLVEELAPERELSRSPLFQVMFDVEVARPGRVVMGGVEGEVYEVGNATAKYDLTVSLGQREEGEWEGVAEYDSDLYEGEWVGRLCGHYVRLLEAAVGSPLRAVGALPMLSAAERRKFLTEWNTVTHRFVRDECLHHLFEAQVARTPNSTALYFEQEQLTYQELNARANQVAHYLRSVGVVAGTLVGVCVERSVGMIVALLGVLKAGGAYLPLDPDYPAQRLAFMLEDSGVEVVLTQQSVGHVLYGGEVRLIYLDTDWYKIQQHPDGNLPQQDVAG